MATATRIALPALSSVASAKEDGGIRKGAASLPHPAMRDRDTGLPRLERGAQRDSPRRSALAEPGALD
ncbi:MAG: hypothetical protein KKD33_00610, partial [Verrucomicrobia bacterium]|nr:hypothetical protein [Verrucomicrobiota bacterium]